MISEIGLSREQFFFSFILCESTRYGRIIHNFEIIIVDNTHYAFARTFADPFRKKEYVHVEKFQIYSLKIEILLIFTWEKILICIRCSKLNYSIIKKSACETVHT